MSIIISTIYGTADPIPYLDEEIGEIQFTQSADVLVLVHPNWPPARFSRYGPSDWRFEYCVFENGPYLPSTAGDDETSLGLTAVTDRLTLTSTDPAEFTGLVNGDLVQYTIEDQKVLGIVRTVGTGSCIVEPLENRSLVMAREVYSPGLFTGWNSAGNVPTYNTTITGTGVTVAFSNTQVATRSTIGNYLRFADKDGAYYWMQVAAVGDILEQGAYGILATGDILTVHIATGVISRSNRTTLGTLTSTQASFFDAARDVGRFYRLNFNNTIIHAKVTAFTSGTVVSVSLSDPVPLTIEGTDRVLDSNTTDWRKGAWYTGNYPATVTFHEERLTFGGSALQPQTFHMSKTGDYFNFASTESNNSVTDDSAIDVTISSDTVNAILWMSTHTTLLAGTVGSEWVISASSNRDAITPSNITSNQQSSYGSEFSKALTVGHSVFYTQRGGNKLREMVYDYAGDSYSSLDVTVFSEHILRRHGGAIQLAYQALPESVIYVLCADGTICALTYEPDQKVYSWSHITIGGPEALVTSIATQLEDSESVLYMEVSRLINGVTVRTTEKLLPAYNPEDNTDMSDMIYLDSAQEIPVLDIAIDGTTTGLTDFAGCTISALLDGVGYNDIPVAVDGSCTLPACPLTSAFVGFQYISRFKSFPIETQGKRGTTQGKIKTVNHLTLRCLDSMGFKHGVDLNDLTEDGPEVAATRESIDKRVPLPNNYDTRGSYYVVQDKPYPLTILALYPEVALHQ